MSFIFIGYSRQDQAYVNTLVQALQAHCLPVWVDNFIDYGSAWPRVIQEHIEQCAAFLVVMSPRSKSSHWVNCELSLALKLKKPIFPLLLEGKRWLSVAAFQSVDVMDGKLPPTHFFETIRGYFANTRMIAKSITTQDVEEQISSRQAGNANAYASAPAQSRSDRDGDIIADHQFDVFLCHNSEDKSAVIEIAQQLQHNRLKPWLDAWELRPGSIWQFALEQQIESIGAAAVFVGKQGLGPWQSEEIYAFLQEFIRRRCPVIPVLLPDALQQPSLPALLRNRHYVDFRQQNPDPLQQLIWGITGQKSDETTSVDIQLISDRHNHFADLENLLSTNNWEEADAETARIMIRFSGDETETQFVYENISDFPCGILLEVDALWLKYSRGKFGFRVQKEIWNRSRRRFENFAVKVGWCINGTWLQDSDLTYDISAPSGHLPSLNWVHIQGWAVGKESSGYNLYRILEKYSSCVKLKSRGKFSTGNTTRQRNPKGFR